MKVQNHLKAVTYRIVCMGPAGAVRLSPEAHDAYLQATVGTDEISMKRSAHLTRYFREFCDHVEFFRRLSEEKFKKEGNFPDGSGDKVAVWTFKAWQWRLYGAIFAVEGRRCFVGVKVDAFKKQNRADQQMLKSTAKEVARLEEYNNRRR
jgi:hypothetical protein